MMDGGGVRTRRSTRSKAWVSALSLGKRLCSKIGHRVDLKCEGDRRALAVVATTGNCPRMSFQA